MLFIWIILVYQIYRYLGYHITIMEKYEDKETEPLEQIDPENTLQDQPAGTEKEEAITKEEPTDMDEASRLRELADVRNQDDLERDITRQADRLLNEQADERDNKRLERTRHEKQYVYTYVLVDDLFSFVTGRSKPRSYDYINACPNPLARLPESAYKTTCKS